MLKVTGCRWQGGIWDDKVRQQPSLMPGTQHVLNKCHGAAQGPSEPREGCARWSQQEASRSQSGNRGDRGRGPEQSAQTRRKLGIGERGGWRGGEQLAANLISSCDRAGQAWPGPTAGAGPGAAGTSPPVTRDVFIKSAESATTVCGVRGASRAGRGSWPRAAWPPANPFSFSASVGPIRHSACSLGGTRGREV